MSCECTELKALKVEADVGADAIWCKTCGCNLELSDFQLSTPLARELREWAELYGQWINWDTDTLIPEGIKMEDHHNEAGILLAEKLKREWFGSYTVTFIPSSMARMYANKK